MGIGVMGMDDWVPKRRSRRGFARVAELERLQKELRRALERAGDAQARAESAEWEADEAERRADAAEARVVATLGPRPEPAPSPPSRPTPIGAGLDLNQATFEQLRVLGLSVTQSARVIAQREQRGGFVGPSDLDGLGGLPREVIETLKERAAV